MPELKITKEDLLNPILIDSGCNFTCIDFLKSKGIGLCDIITYENLKLQKNA